MISVKLLGKTIEKFAVNNAPMILTSVGAVGAAASSYFTYKGTVEATMLVDEELERRRLMNEAQLDKLGIFKLVWKEYVPAVGTLTLTVGCIIFANRISAKRAAALMLAYSLHEKSFEEYREKVVEKFTPNKERAVQDEIAQDRVTANPPKDSQVIITGNGDVLCYDMPSDRYFKSNMEKLRSVQNDVNSLANEFGEGYLCDLYTGLGLNPTSYSDELGWKPEHLLEMKFSAVLTDDNTPCISINYHPIPLRGNNDRAKGCEESPPF